MLKKIIKNIITFPFYALNHLIDLLSLLSTQFKKISLDYHLDYLDGLTLKVEHVAKNNKQININFFMNDVVASKLYILPIYINLFLRKIKTNLLFFVNFR